MKRLNKIKFLMLLSIVLILAVGCDVPRWYCPPPCDDYDYEDYWAPPVPQNVHSVTGDGKIYIYWDPVRACDLAGYRVWRSRTEHGYYYLIAETRSANYVDYDVVNGHTYYYAISAFDEWGNESELSEELVFDTPRPEGHSYRAYIVEEFPDDAGYDFSAESVVPYDCPCADIFFGYDDYDESYYIQACDENTDILIYGPTDDLTDVDWAPEDGWISGAKVNIYDGYSYLVWTRDNHFAHIRIKCLCGDYVVFDWAYQTDRGNPELSTPETNEDKVALPKIFREHKVKVFGKEYKQENLSFN